MTCEPTHRTRILLVAVVAVLVALFIPATGHAAGRDKLASAGVLERGVGYGSAVAKTWRQYTDWAKHRPLMLRLADTLGRGRGRLRWFDGINPPLPAPFVPQLSDWKCRDLAAVWIGHATVLRASAG